MKTCRIKAFLTALFLASFTLPISSVPATKETKFPIDNEAIRKDIANIGYEKTRVREVKSELKASCKAGSMAAVNQNKKALAKAKADLHREWAYLKADKRDLVLDHKATIQAARKTVRSERADIRTSKRKLFKDMVKGRESVVSGDAEKLAMHERNLKYDKNLLHARKEDKKSDMAMVSTELKNANLEPATVKYADKVMARVEGKKKKEKSSKS